MIDYLIEMIFKNISAEEIGSLLKDLTSDGQEISNYNFTCECPAINWNDEKSIKEVFLKYKDFGLFINLKKLKKNGVELVNSGIVVYKFENKIDLEINFQLSSLNNYHNQELTNNLMKLAKSIATQHKIDLYFGGIEPAEEATTRLFTKEEVGPYSIE